MKELLNSRFVLDRQHIAESIEKLDEILRKETKQTDRDILRTKLTYEEILLNCMQDYPENTECEVACSKQAKNLKIVFRIKADKINPLRHSDEDEVAYNILERVGIGPAYRYRRDCNIITLNVRIKKKINGLIVIGAAVVLAVITALLMNLLPTDVCNIIDNAFINPFFDKLSSILQAFATPLVFFSVITGIVGIGDVKSLGKLGSKLIKNMFITYAFGAIVVGVLGSIVLGIGDAAHSAGNGDVIKEIVQLVLNIVPSNLIEPFYTDNALQVVTLAVFFGVVILILANKLQGLIDIINQISTLINKMMLYICQAIPLIVYLGILATIRSGNINEALQCYKSIVLFIVSAILIISFVVIKVKRTTKGSVKPLLKACVPTAMINLATSSQVAAYPENSRCCKEDLGLNPKLVDFGLPLGMVTYMPNGAACLALCTWSMYIIEFGGLNIVHIVQLLFLATIVAIAAPPIPGSGVIVLPILFSGMGLSSDTLPLAIVFMTLLGYFLPLFNGFCLQMELLLTGRQLETENKSISSQKSL